VVWEIKIDLGRIMGDCKVCGRWCIEEEEWGGGILEKPFRKVCRIRDGIFGWHYSYGEGGEEWREEPWSIYIGGGVMIVSKMDRGVMRVERLRRWEGGWVGMEKLKIMMIMD
jgi:hypothetical protein